MAENLEDARRLSGGLLRPLRVTAPGRTPPTTSVRFRPKAEVTLSFFLSYLLGGIVLEHGILLTQHVADFGGLGNRVALNCRYFAIDRLPACIDTSWFQVAAGLLMAVALAQ